VFIQLKKQKALLSLK